MAVKSPSALSASLSASRRVRLTASILFSARMAGRPAAFSPSMMDRVSGLIFVGRGVDQQHHQIGILGALPGGRHHRPLQPPLGLENARRVDEHKLAVAVQGDAEHPRPRGLHLRARRSPPWSRQSAFSKRRLAGIRGADQGDEAAASLAHCSPPSSAQEPGSRSCAAAWRSATRFDVPRGGRRRMAGDADLHFEHGTMVRPAA